MRFPVLALFLAWAGVASAAGYQVTLAGIDPPRIEVAATLPIDGDALAMSSSRPGDVPGLDAKGWPFLVKALRITDEAGTELPHRLAGDAGWKLAARHRGNITLRYELDYALLAARDWPAPRESVYADAGHVVLAGRAVFITTAATRAADVTFRLPAGWNAATPWAGPASPNDLVENLFVLSRVTPRALEAGQFRMLVVAMGHWETAAAEVERTLVAVVPQLTAMMGFDDAARYLVVLMPQRERAGEAFRNSFALAAEAVPTAANRGVWGNTLAHEIFHYWNGMRLEGADYASSQWFQEGFTEYAANRALWEGGLESREDFERRMQAHAGVAAKLATPLDAPGNRKGPPLYSAGALTAFTWDTWIREESGGQRSLANVMRTLWKATGDGARPYEWKDIRAALESVSSRDWEAYRRDCISALPGPACRVKLP